MIIKVMKPAGPNFPGVNYNEKKIDKGKGELMMMKNFPSFINQSSGREEVKSYLALISKNEKVRKPQFHAALSTKFREHSKEELTKIAENFMDEMGYGKQPFIVVFHNDTENNHVHIVSTRVDKSTGKKINDSYEKLKSQRAVALVMEKLYGVSNEENLNKLLSYRISSLQQLEILLKRNGFSLSQNKEDETKLDIFKNGVLEKTISGNQIVFDNKKNENRTKQIKAILSKYKELYSCHVFKVEDRRKQEGMLPEEKQYNDPEPKIEFESEFQKKLKNTFGIDIVFHHKDGQRPFGYSLIDNKEGKVFKGSEIMKMSELFEFTSSKIDKRLFERLKDFNIRDQETKGVLLDFLKTRYPENRLQGFMLFENKKIKSKEIFNAARNDVKEYLKTQNNADVSIVKSDDGKYYAIHCRLHYIGEVEKLIGVKEAQNFVSPSAPNAVQKDEGLEKIFDKYLFDIMKSAAAATGFEINEITAKIAKIFHPGTDINLRSFETEFIGETGLKADPQEFKNRYDLIIGNPPYGDHRGYYKGLGEEPSLSKYEDYFVKRSLDVLKEGGTLAMVLPSGWLNRQKKINDAEITNAFRLPSGAFAGTKIGTDIIILKKNASKKAQDISGYFEHHQDKVLGEIKERTNQFGRMEPYVSGTLDNALLQIEKILSQKNTERIGNLFEDYFTSKDMIRQVDDPSTLLSIEETAQSAISDKREERKTLLTNAQNKVIEVLQSLDDIKFKSPSVNAEIRKYEKYNKSIDTLSPEQLDKLFKSAEKILQRSTVKNEEYRVQSKPDIKPSILKYQFKKEDSIVAASLQNSSDLSQELLNAFKDTHYDGTLNNHAQHYAFANYIDGRWVHDFYYVEGNIYKKLEQLEKDFSDKNANGGTKDQYEKQKALLESVLPKVKSLEQIIMSPNHEFVHQFHLGTVERLQWNRTSRQSEPPIVKYNLAEKFKDFVRDLPSDAFGGSSSWEVREFVDNESVTGSDKERNALIRERRKEAANDLFGKFIREELSEELKERFVKEFNKNYNNIHVPDYSKFPLFSNIYQNFKGKELRLTEVQKGGVGRMTTKGVGLLAHEVGFGKTLSGILAMHEGMERGNAVRPLIVVPNNSILKQWADTIFETIPDAKVNILGNLGRDYDLSKFDNKDGEITLVTYEGFNNIGFSNEITERLASSFNFISASELKGITNSERDFQKELEKDKEMQGKMKRGKIYDWEDFGFDHLTFDEAHNANHIVGKVRIEDRRFASDFRSQNQQTSKLGINTWMAAQYIQDQNNGRNVSLLSATPFTNKPLEYYSILSLIANDRLKESGYFNVNTFFETFMEADNDMEIDAKGDVKFKNNVRRFKNNSLFQQLLSEFIDIKGEEDNPELVRPNKFNKEYKIGQNNLTQEQYDLLAESFNDTKKGAILTHILNARKIAISPYLSPYYDNESPTVKEFVENSPKLNETMNLIRQNKKDIPESGQIIYSELAVEEFPKLKEYLMHEVGYRSEEVGIITGATSKANRLKTQDDFNSGKIKIVIGSEAIQEGMNLQENTSDLYLLTLPYNFTSLRQVEGRFWRQGNRHENIRTNFMLTNDSIDVFMLQKLQAKQARYLEAMRKGADVIDISDINAQELKTAIITNPETRANIEIEIQQKKIENEKNKFLADSAFVLRKYEEYTKEKEKVTHAELTYSRIEGYANEGDEKSDYWINQLPHYQRMIDLAKIDLEKVAQKLIEKGVNVTEIEKQTEISEAKIEKLEFQIENLPQLREELVSQYRLEKEESLRIAENCDYVREREMENTELFKNKYLDKVVSNKEENIVGGESKSYSSRKR